MEGITDHIYRTLHAKFFGGAEKYFSPFLSPTSDGIFSNKELRDILPENNAGISLVPQILAKNPDDFLWAANKLCDLGYTEINLNLGCPSGTVVAKGKGSGMLRDTYALEKYLDGVFSVTPLPLSVKTRIGFSSPDEFPEILGIYNKYPIKELIIHPRTKAEMYNGNIHYESFEYAVRNTNVPLCFNGNILSRTQAEEIAQKFPSVGSVMIGRGLVACPFMLSGQQSKQKIFEFSEALINAYTESFGKGGNVLPRMKELWVMMISSFEDDLQYEKKLRKADNVTEFRQIIGTLITDLKLKKI